MNAAHFVNWKRTSFAVECTTLSLSDDWYATVTRCRQDTPVGVWHLDWRATPLAYWLLPRCWWGDFIMSGLQNLPYQYYVILTLITNYLKIQLQLSYNISNLLNLQMTTVWTLTSFEWLIHFIMQSSSPSPASSSPSTKNTRVRLDDRHCRTPSLNMLGQTR